MAMLDRSWYACTSAWLILLVLVAACSRGDGTTAGQVQPGASTPTTEVRVKNPVGYFEIPVADLDRAMAFYAAVFGAPLERTEIDHNQMALFPAHDGAPGITGALAKGDSYVPGRQGARLYFSTPDIDETLRRVLRAGGKVLYPKTSIGALGWVAEFEDSEGNCIALHSE